MQSKDIFFKFYGWLLPMSEKLECSSTLTYITPHHLANLGDRRNQHSHNHSESHLSALPAYYLYTGQKLGLNVCLQMAYFTIIFILHNAINLLAAWLLQYVTFSTTLFRSVQSHNSFTSIASQTLFCLCLLLNALFSAHYLQLT